MVGIFDILPVYFGAACISVILAMPSLSGTLWKWIAIIPAGIGGWLACRLFLKGVSKLLDFHTKKKLLSLSVTELDTRLGNPDSPEWDLIMFELKSRGEELTKYRSRLINLLGDEDCSCRLFAIRALKAVFPNDLGRLVGYSPYESAEICRAKAQHLRNTMNVQQGS